ncbi:hypothetical protein D9Q98_005472 [Chlorella vulgaris]|uniref:Uncharacterized protein n=1 Tax=Chlorella vulgaris TaxID=3077 RepID=A0A9D4TMA7_CHLVU|nr:hypothetical protein D9Q98_005472 [Chlorella vulgaris]
MPGGNGLLANDVLRWKVIGAGVWAAAVAATALSVVGLVLHPLVLLSPARLLGSFLRPSAWLSAFALVMAQAPAFAAAALALRAAEPRPPQAHRLVQWPRLAPLSMLLSKLSARLDSLADAARSASFLALHALSAALFLSMFSGTHYSSWSLPGGASWTLLYSASLAVLYLLHMVHWSHDVAAFPSVQRHRYFRVKHRLGSAFVQACKLAAAALFSAAAAALLHSRVLAGKPAIGPEPGRTWLGLGPATVPWSLDGMVAALVAGALCAFCWLGCSLVLEVVVTERLRQDNYSDPDVLGAMAACLGGSKGPLMQALTLHDTCLLASDTGRAALRRAQVFGDETGAMWRPVAAACIAELDGLVAAVAAAQSGKPVGSSATGAKADGAGAKAHKWNVLPSALSSKGGLGSSKQQLEALLAARCGYPQAALAARALAGFACASLQEDRFGVLQLTQPGLAEVLMCLLGTLGATQQLMRSTASLAPRQLSLGPWRGDGNAAAWSGCYRGPSVDVAAYALRDTLTVVLYRICTAFGSELVEVLANSKAPPAYGTPSEAAALLQRFLQGQA